MTRGDPASGGRAEDEAAEEFREGDICWSWRSVHTVVRILATIFPEKMLVCRCLSKRCRLAETDV